MSEEDGLGYVNIITNNSNVKEQTRDVIKVQGSSLRKLTTLKHFRKETSVDLTGFE
jgi:hypothetical protein